jgi:hypothetical protein
MPERPGAEPGVAATESDSWIARRSNSRTQKHHAADAQQSAENGLRVP